MQAVILAAGLGQRLYPFTKSCPKGLLKVAGRELLFRHLYLLTKEGIKDFVLVVNTHNKKAFEDFLREHPFPVRLVVNPFPELGNGYSLLVAKDLVTETFILTMSDHIYEPAFVKEAVRGQGLIYDPQARFVDPGEATKVLCQNGRVKNIGKHISNYSGFDTGFFVLTPEIFLVAEELARKKEPFSLSTVVQQAALPCTPIQGYFWMDIDTPEDLKKATRNLLSCSVKGRGDGLVSRLLNRRVSTWCSARLINILSPNQATLFTFLLGLLAALVTYWWPRWGIALYQLSSMLDGMDGEIARASLRTTAFGGWLDSVLDRVVDFVFLFFLSFHVPWSDPKVFVAIYWAIFGSLMVSYTTERFRGAFGQDAYALLHPLRFWPGKRDERVFLCFVLGWWGKFIWIFVLLAFITNLRVLFTLVLVWHTHGKV